MLLVVLHKEETTQSNTRHKKNVLVEQARLDPVHESVHRTSGDHNLRLGLLMELHDVGALTRTSHEDRAIDAGLLFVFSLESLLEGLYGLSLDECDGAASETASGHTGTEDALHILGDVDEGVQLRGGDLIVRLQGLVGLVEVLTSLDVVVVLEGFDAILSTLVLVDDLGIRHRGRDIRGGLFCNRRQRCSP